MLSFVNENIIYLWTNGTYELSFCAFIILQMFQSFSQTRYLGWRYICWNKEWHDDCATIRQYLYYQFGKPSRIVASVIDEQTI